MTTSDFVEKLSGHLAARSTRRGFFRLAGKATGVLATLGFGITRAYRDASAGSGAPCTQGQGVGGCELAYPNNPCDGPCRPGDRDESVALVLLPEITASTIVWSATIRGVHSLTPTAVAAVAAPVARTSQLSAPRSESAPLPKSASLRRYAISPNNTRK